MDRRHVLTGAAVAAGASAFGQRAQAADGGFSEKEIREYLAPLVNTREEVDAWLNATKFPFSRYDAGLGYLHRDRDFKEGIHGAIASYRYDELDARRMFAYADQPCRINTYGNSFTSCEQVSDGETWQEVLASHLGEPVRNYGIGGYSVYQAFLRMKREEQRAPARFIVFNIFDDDHSRNVHAWLRVKFGTGPTSINATVPHVVVDPDRRTFEERPNPCPTKESLYRLCDLDSVTKMFGSNRYLQARLRRAQLKKSGENVSDWDYDDKRLHRYGLYATQRIVEMVEGFAKTSGKKVLYVLSYGGYVLEQFLKTRRRFDQSLVDFLKQRNLPFVDLLQAHATDFAQFKVTPRQYVNRYYIGHYAPLGNVFCANAIRGPLVRMLDPKPPAYQPQ